MGKKPGNGGSKRKEKDEAADPSTRIVRLVNAAGAKLFHTVDHEAFADIKVGNHRETWRLKDPAFKHWIGSLYYQEMRKAPSDLNTGAALNVLEGQANYAGEEKTVHIRVAQLEDRIYIDLANDRWEVVEIAASGWRVSADSPVKFRRPRGMETLPSPVRGGTMTELRPFVNVGNEDHFLLILGWLVAAFRPTGPYPILVLEGNHGSAKSTTSRLIRSLIDPNSAPLRSTPASERDLMISASNAWCPLFDNVSHIKPWLSDCLCRLSTGGGFSTRQNYTDDEEKMFNATRPLMLNGIRVGMEKADLLDRSIVILLDEIQDSERKTETEIRAKVKGARPRIFGALLDAVSCALRRLAQVEIAKPPRMADFAYWASAAEPSFGCQPGAFLKAYEANRQDANELSLEASVLVPYFKAIAEEAEWSGTAAELLQALNEAAKKDGSSRDHNWPRNPARLAGEIRRLLPNLSGADLKIEMRKTAGTNSRKLITISKTGDSKAAMHASNASEASLPSLVSLALG
jgi:hypothetical protein